MTAAETLRDAIQQKATAIAAKSSSVAVDQMAADIVVLAASIPNLPPSAVDANTTDFTAVNAILDGAGTEMNRAIAGVRAMIRLSGTPVGTTPFPIAAKLGMSVQPSSGPTNDVAFSTQPQVVVQDTGGVTVPLSGTTITAALASGTGTLGGTLTAVTASTGIATFSNLKITGTAGPFTIVFTATSLSSITSGTVTTVAGAATKLAMQVEPNGAVTTVPLTSQPVVILVDVSANAVGTGTPNVVAALASGTGSLSGTTTKAAVAGVATFTDLVYTGTGSFTIQFTSSGLTSVTSTTVTTPNTFFTPNILNNADFESGWSGFTTGSLTTPPGQGSYSVLSLDNTTAFSGTTSVKRTLPIMTSNPTDDHPSMFYWRPGGVPIAVNRWWVRFYFKFSPAPASNMILKFQWNYSDGANQNFRGFQISNNVIKWMWLENSSGVDTQLSTPLWNDGNWHYLEYDLFQNGDTSYDGQDRPSVAIWYDGNLLAPADTPVNKYLNGRIHMTATRINSTARKLGMLELQGVLNGNGFNSTASVLWFDRVAISTAGRIGP